MQLHGGHLIAGERTGEGGATFHATTPAPGERRTPPFHEASDADVDRALVAAEAAFDPYRTRAPAEIAAFLERIAEEITTLGDELIGVAAAETGLPAERLT